MKPFLKKTVPLIGLAGLGSLPAPAVHAAVIDVSGVVTEIGNQVASVVLIGGAVLALIVMVKAFIRVRGALRQKTGCARNGASPAKGTSWHPACSSSLPYWGVVAHLFRLTGFFYCIFCIFCPCCRR